MIFYLVSYFLLFFSHASAMDNYHDTHYPLEELRLAAQMEDEDEQSLSTYKPIPAPIPSIEDFFLACALHAAYYCDAKRLKQLVNNQNVNQVNRKGQTILFGTIKRSFDDPQAPIEGSMEYLIEAGACIDTLDYQHCMSAVEYATRLAVRSKTPNFRALNYLLAKGASPFIAPPDSPKKSAFDVAADYAREKNSAKYPHALAVLEIFKEKTQTIHDAVISCNVEKVNELAAGENVNSLDGDKKTPLYVAVSRFNEFNRMQTLQIINRLLLRGAAPNAQVINMPFRGNTHFTVATIISIIQGNMIILPSFISYGADPHFKVSPDTPSAYEIACAASKISQRNIIKFTQRNYGKQIKHLQARELATQDIAFYLELMGGKK